MDDGAPFDRYLEAVFGERAASFSGDLRDLLRQLWAEGVKHGRQAERLEAVNRHVRNNRVIGIDPGSGFGPFFIATRDGSTFRTRQEAMLHEYEVEVAKMAIASPETESSRWNEYRPTSPSSHLSSTRDRSSR